MSNIEKASLKNKFFKPFFIFLLVFFIIYISFLLAFIISGNFSYAYSKDLQKTSELVELILEEDVESTSFLTSPVRTNILLVGLDKSENLTDTIIVASFISTTGQINLISIPRDTYVTFSGESLSKLRSVNSSAPSVMKINAINSYGGSKGIELLEEKIEELLGIRIDYYIKVDLDAFKSIVDTIGGIYFDVPEGGLYYSDPTQGLYINLKEGYQLLDGNAAEGLVRFRKGYALQDLQRVVVQQEFIKAFISQVLNKETLIKNIGGLILSFIKYVDTNFSILDIPKYLTSISKINTETIQNTTLPGSAQTINNASYYIMDSEATKELVNEYFYGSTSASDLNLEEEQNTQEEGD